METWREELYHFGVKGMKWGVRRYQNYNGSYTREGLRRFNETAKRYDAVNQLHKQFKQKRRLGLASDYDVALAKRTKKKYKNILKSEYKQLRRDKKADQGKALYAEGRRITDDYKKVLTGYTIASGSTYVSVKLRTMGYEKASMAAGLVAVGASAVSSIYGVKTNMDAKKLRAYYSHSRPVHNY